MVISSHVQFHNIMIIVSYNFFVETPNGSFEKKLLSFKHVNWSSNRKEISKKLSGHGRVIIFFSLLLKFQPTFDTGKIEVYSYGFGTVVGGGLVVTAVTAFIMLSSNRLYYQGSSYQYINN